jgi:hypothetical protein
MESILGTLRRNTTVVFLGLKFSTAVGQLSALTQTVNELGFSRTMEGVRALITAPRGTTGLVLGKSTYMTARQIRYDREVEHLDNTWTPTDLAKWRNWAFMKDFFFAGLRIMDQAAAVPTWIAGYNEAIARHMSEEDAIAFADQVVRRTQGGGSVVELSGAQRGGELQKLLTMFGTFFSVFHNQFSEIHARKRFNQISWMTFFSGYMWLLIVPAMFGWWINQRKWPSAEDAGGAIVGYAVSGIPFVRDAVNHWLTRYDYSMSPVAGAVTSTGKLFSALYPFHDVQNRGWKIVKSAMEAAGYAWGLPSRQAIVTLEGAIDLMSGETMDPTRLILKEVKED